jgi:hypothetical protein
VSANVQSTRALSLRQLDTVQSYLKSVTPSVARQGFAIQRVIEDGFYATVDLEDETATFVFAFSDRAADRLDARYDQLVVTLDVDEGGA